MKRFKFRLDRVLQLRQMAEDEAAREVTLAQQAAERTALEAGAAERALLHAVAQTADYAQGTTVGVLSAMRMSLDGARERVRLTNEMLVQSQQVVERRLEAWRTARGEREALEKLKTQRKDVWTSEVNRAEQADIDEVALRSRFDMGDQE